MATKPEQRAVLTAAQLADLDAIDAAVSRLRAALAESAPPADPPAPDDQAPTPVPLPASGRYRDQQPRLFQGSAWAVDRATLTGLPDRTPNWGPNAEHVDISTGWAWARSGGDWLDAAGTPYGTAPWASVRTDAGPADLLVRAYQLDVTALLGAGQWAAWRLSAINGHRRIAGTHHPDAALRPALRITMADGSVVDAACVCSASAKSGTPNVGAADLGLPAFLEFDRPDGDIASATLTVTCLAHPGSGAVDLYLMLLDPPRNSDPVQLGAAAETGPLDDGLASVPGIIGSHRYIDGMDMDDVSVRPSATSGQANYLASRNFDPALWGGAADATKYPHLHAGKFVVAHGDLELVPSSHQAPGYAPLAPGLAAMRVRMPRQATDDGQYVGYGGTGACSAMLYLPESRFGLQDRIFVRAYYRVHGVSRTRDDTLQVYKSANSAGPAWTDHAGKFGIVPVHTTTLGGTSGSGGGGRGWSGWYGWHESDAEHGGPNEGAWAPGWHLYDLGVNNPAGHRYSGDTGRLTQWGQRGGYGGAMYEDTWYCIETEVKLNTVMPESPGYAPDGELRVWVDGRLAYGRTGLVMRTLPVSAWDTNNGAIRGPVRELGVAALWLIWYHGGVTQSAAERELYVTGLAWADRYIGPMRGVTP